MINYEEKSLNAWPALINAYFLGCIVRLSNGYTNRANCANPLYVNSKNFIKTIAFVEDFYNKNKQPSIFKIIGTKRYKEFDKILIERNYIEISNTTVMTCKLKEIKTQNNPSVKVENIITDDWFNSFASLNNLKNEHLDVARKMLNLIALELIVCSIKEKNKIIACGYGAIDNDYVGFFDIVVDEKRRNNGYGKSLILQMINEAKKKNVKIGYLQVMDNNLAAKNLYSNIGFKSNYKYWYRKKDET